MDGIGLHHEHRLTIVTVLVCKSVFESMLSFTFDFGLSRNTPTPTSLAHQRKHILASAPISRTTSASSYDIVSAPSIASVVSVASIGTLEKVGSAIPLQEMSANYTHLNDDSTSPAATTVRTSTDHTPLLGESEENEEDVPVEEDDKGTATATSAVVNLANTILGTGMLAQPAAIASLGLLLGALMIGFAGFTSALGLYFLSRCASRTPPRQSSFNAVAKLTFPHAAVLFDIAIAVKCFGVSISYLIIIGDLMPKVVQILSPNGDIGDVALFLLDRRFWITVFMAVIIPLSFLKKLDSLRYTSMIALVAVVYLLFIVVFYFFDPSSPSPPPGSVRLINLSTDFFTNLPVFIFAFTCHQNVGLIVPLISLMLTIDLLHLQRAA